MANNAVAVRPQSDEELFAYWMGRGSVMSRTEQGRKHHICTMAQGDKSVIDAYKQGRYEGQVQKKEYLKQKRQERWQQRHGRKK